MTVNYTSLLKLAQPVNGSEDGAWGTVVNESLTSPVEIAIAGAATIDVTSGNVTLTNGDGSASNQSRYAILLVTGTPGVTRNVIAPGTSKIYLIKNSSDGSVVIKGASTTGVTIPAGEEVFVFWNGSDYEIASIAGPSVATDNAVARFDGTTGKILQNSAVTIADTTGDITGGKYNGLTISTTTGTLTVANGKTLTASNTITLAGTDGTTMTFPGTSASVARTDAAQTFTGVQTFSSSPIISALTADKLVFTDSSKALVSSGSVGTDQGGTGQTTYTAGDMVYYATGTAMTKLGIGTTNYVLTSSGSAPQWSAPASVVIGTATNIQGGAAGSVPYQSGVSTTTFLGIGSAAQVLQVNAGGTAPEWVSSTGTGSVVRATSPTLVTPALGTPSTINLTNATNLPLGSITGLGTGVATALAINVGSGGAFVPTTGSGASGTWSISVTGSAASATTSTNLAGGAANRIAYQTGSDTTAFIVAPTTSNTFLKWNGTSLGWDTVSGGGGGTTTNPVTFNNTGGGASSGTTFDGSSAVTISYNTIGAPSTTGGGATGNWNINITGSAASATTATSATSATTATTATNIAGGTASQIPYQSGVGATTFVTAPTTSGSFLKWNGTTYVWDVPAGGGDVVGPASATDNAIARFDGTSGKIIQNSAVTIADTTGDITGGKYNGLTITTSTGTLTIANGKTLTANNTLTLSGTDSTTMTFPAASTTVAGLGTTQTFTGINTFTPAARTSGAASYFTVTTPADTGQTASTEVIGANYTAATRQWSTGALTLQRERVFAAPTYSFVGASTLTTAVNVDIATPVQGTNATITNAYALRAGASYFTGTVVADGNATFNANVTLGDQTSDTITATARLASDLVPSTNNARDLGTSALAYRSVYAGTSFVEAGYNVVTQTDIGTAPNEIPLNQYLGSMAYQDADTSDITVYGVRVGRGAGAVATNTAVGASALAANTTGAQNAAFGWTAGQALTSGTYSTAVGSRALQATTTGNSNTAVGTESLFSNTTASNNTAVGYQALYNSTGADNTSLGYQAGDVITTGTGNVIIGKGADPSVNSATDQIVIGNGVTGQANTNVTIGNATGKIYNAYTVNATWTQTSDGTMKNVIGPDSLGLSFINRLNPILFTWKAQNDLPPDHPYYAEENKRDTTRVIHGFVAQEVKAALDAEGCSTFNGWDQGDDGIQAISREMFISPLVKAVQELSAQVDQLKAELAALKGA